MLYEIGKEIESELRSRGCPYPIAYGPERIPTSITNCRIVVERNRGASENISAPKSRAPNPRMIAARSIAGRFRVFAKSSKAGANTQDHEREADLVADLLIVALHACVRRRCTECRLDTGKILTAQDMEYQSISAWPGAVYEMTFEVDRGVCDTAWTGEKRPEVTIGGTSGVSFETAQTIVGGNAGTPSLPSADTRTE